MVWRNISSMPSASPCGYPAQPQPQPEPRQSSLPPRSPLRDIALDRAAGRRDRGNFDARMRPPLTRAQQMETELFFPVHDSASSPHQASMQGITPSPAQHQPPRDSVALPARCAPPGHDGVQGSSISDPTVSLANTMSSAGSRVSASHIEAFFATARDSGGAFALPQLTFDGDSRRLTPACEVALRQQYDRLMQLRRQSEQYILDIERTPELKAGFAGMDGDIEEDLDKILKRCEDTMNSIALRTAQSRIPVTDDPVAVWVATKMMHSAESRKELGRYLQDHRPLELQVKTNLMTQLNTRLARLPSSNTGPEYAEQRENILSKIDSLQREIDVLKQSVGNHPLPLHETATELTQEVTARYLAARYHPVRGHLHQMREDIQQLLRRKQCSLAEQRQLEVFARQVQETLDGIQNLEYQCIWLQIEDSHARQQVPYIPYSPEAAVSLDTRIAFYSALSASPPAPDYPHDLRRQSEDSQQRHRQAYQTYQHQLSVQQATGAAIHPNVIADLESASRAAEASTAIYRNAEAKFSRDYAQWREAEAAARKNQALKELTESVQYTMLDDKINTLIKQGFRTLRDAPEPKPKAGEIDKLHGAYLAQQEKFRATVPGMYGSVADLPNELTVKMAFLNKA